jgi:hypothetical protein
MSPTELASLEMMTQIQCLVTDIPYEHAEKLVNFGLARRDLTTLRITPLGQLELLRQHFHGVKPNRRAARKARERGASLAPPPPPKRRLGGMRALSFLALWRPRPASAKTRRH